MVVGGVVRLLVDTDDEHRGIGRGSRDDDLLGSTLEMLAGLVNRGEDTGRLDDEISTVGAPGDGGGVLSASKCEL